jgi:hypothetical protein
MEATFRRATEEDQPALLGHFLAAFGRWPWVEIAVPPLEHLAWKMEAGPGPPEHYVAEVDGRIVAAKLHHIWPVRVGGRELRTVRGYDSSVHPDYRDRGLMNALRDAAIRDMTPRTELLCGGSDNPAMSHLMHQGDRVRFAERWSVLTRYFSARAALEPLRPRRDVSARRLARSTANLAHWLRLRAFDRSGPDTTPWAVRAVESFDGRIDGLCREASAPFDLIMVRSARLLNWRYADRRAGPFTILQAEQDGRILGYLTLRVQRETGYIADVLALPGRTDVVGSLAREATRRFAALGAARAECWLMPSHPYAPALAGCGYVRRTGRMPPTLEAVNVPREEIAFLGEPGARVHFTIGDTDLV